MVGRGEFMDVHEAWVRGKSVSEIARLTGRDRKTIRRLLREGGPKPRAPREVSSKLDPYRGSARLRYRVVRTSLGERHRTPSGP